MRAFAAVLTVLVSTPVWADEAACTSAVCGTHRPRPPRFDASTVVTMSGRIERVRREDHGGWKAVHLDVRTLQGVLEVALGPAAFVDLYAKFEADQELTVTGSRVEHHGHPLLLATRLTRRAGEGAPLVVEFRSEDGTPLF